MSIRAQPNVTPQDIIRVQPLHYVEDPRGEDWGSSWQSKGRPIEVVSRKLTSAEQFVEGKSSLTVAYVLYATYRRGRPFPVHEKDRIWHPEGSARNSDGTPNYATALEISSVVPYPKEGVCQIDCGRTY